MDDIWKPRRSRKLKRHRIKKVSSYERIRGDGEGKREANAIDVCRGKRKIHTVFT